ncbi:MAG: hypothetical protein DRJ47_11040 [Thermoprotei archaeon]|nr:MAG: hypothetical protein DRJ47_11040 [Thermoprotei archaeon]
MRRRSYIDVLVEILNEALNGCTKTRLIYRCNLNYQSSKRHLNKLLNARLLVKVKQTSNNATLYKTSEKGKELLQVLRRAKRLISG